MHEYSLVESMLGRVEEQVKAHGGIAVSRVVVDVGELSGVEPELLQTAFEMLREQTICSRALLDVRKVPAIWSCSGCGQVIETGAELSCPECRLPAKLSDGGDAVILASLEVEVP
jgi:hydrogenase nickel incorporation protein HypA/HybF